MTAFFPDTYLEWAVTIAAPAYGLAKEYAELVWQASGALPFLGGGPTDGERLPGLGVGPASRENGLHATANPNFVNYAMELYEKDVFQGWFYTPGNSYDDRQAPEFGARPTGSFRLVLCVTIWCG